MSESRTIARRVLWLERRRRAEWCFVMVLSSVVACGRDRAIGPASSPVELRAGARESSVGSAHGSHGPVALDLLDALRNGEIDSNGPVVDLGESQSEAFILPPTPGRVIEVNGDSWAQVGTRLRLRVPIDTNAPPDRIRLRARRVRARKVLALVDGVPVRQAWFPDGAGTHIVELPVSPERFSRAVSSVELRFLGVTKVEDSPESARALRRGPLPPAISAEEAARTRDGGAATTASVVAAPAQPPALELDWVHVCRAGASVSRVVDLVSDVRVDHTPRRSLTLYPPTRASWITVLPAAATLRTAIAAEGIRGANAKPVRARIRVEVDDATPIEHTLDVRPNERWSEVSLDLSSFAHRAARLSVAAELAADADAGPPSLGARADVRVAFADPRVLTSLSPPQALPPVRHALFVVVRGLRVDRVLPAVHERLSHGGFARLSREGLVARAQVVSGRELPALASMMTGLEPQSHRVEDWTDTHDERAPTMGSLLREGGMATALFSDDKWLEGSGLDRGYGEVRSCPGESARCRSEIPLGLAAEWLSAQRDRRAFAMVVTRAGIPPFDPPRDLLLQLDPNPAENALQPEGTAIFALNPRASETLPLERVVTLYDAALANLDRALGQALDRLREVNMLDQMLIVVVGSRGTALGEGRYIGEGPSKLAVVHETALMVRAPGVRPRVLTEVVDALDANATVLERLGVAGPWRGPLAPVSLASVGALGAHPRGFISALGAHHEPALRFGSLLAMTARGGSLLALLSPEQDPLGVDDLRAQKPIAVAFAERSLASAQSSEGVALERYTPSTRALSDAVVAALRQGIARH